MRRVFYECSGVLLLLASVVFFLYSVRFLGEREYVGATLQIFVGFALIRAGLELTRLSLLLEERE